MRSANEVDADIEKDRSSREAEIRLIHRLSLKAEKDDERDSLRRSSVLLVYAHMEGFCKFAFSAYAGAINSAQMPCADASYPIAAASLSRVFAALRDSSFKHEAFKKGLPDDTQLHLLAREQIFMRSFEDIKRATVDIPDKVIDTKSNLSSAVLQKLLFQLGLDITAVAKHDSNLNKLLGVRNAIAHGDQLKVPSPRELDDYRDSAFTIMRHVQYEVVTALRQKTYLRDPNKENTMDSIGRASHPTLSAMRERFKSLFQ